MKELPVRVARQLVVDGSLAHQVWVNDMCGSPQAIVACVVAVPLAEQFGSVVAIDGIRVLVIGIGKDAIDANRLLGENVDHHLDPIHDPKNVSNQLIWIVGGVDRRSDEPANAVLVLYVFGGKHSAQRAAAGLLGMRGTGQAFGSLTALGMTMIASISVRCRPYLVRLVLACRGAIHNSVQRFALELEPMDVHHCIGRVNESILEFRRQIVVGTSVVEGDPGSIMVSMVAGVDSKRILHPDSLSKMGSSSHGSVRTKVFGKLFVGKVFEGCSLFREHDRRQVDTAPDAGGQDCLHDVPIRWYPHKGPVFRGIWVCPSDVFRHDLGSVH
mmetsp:Transcript_13722/g.38629  ORF Transcript_13722/g.38629 Transcript_13722/m.38629 type:complete len:328 (-) Transcript_13722:579-1562(-)